jgi:hypothetical protein
MKRFLALLLMLPSLLLAQSDNRGLPPLEPTAPEFADDTFTFVRLHPVDHVEWDIDFPDADINFSYRLQQTTSLKVNQKPITMAITDPAMFSYPFVYAVEPGKMHLNDEEAEALRRYLLNGGCLMLDDFWGEDEWANVVQQIHHIFPDREIVDLPLSHPIFHCIFDLKEKPQIPGINHWVKGSDVTWELPDAKEVHYRAVFDDKGRMMILICQNTDLGDSWEREGDDADYFHTFSEKKGYPVSINIIFYLMSH